MFNKRPIKTKITTKEKVAKRIKELRIEGLSTHAVEDKLAEEFPGFPKKDYYK